MPYRLYIAVKGTIQGSFTGETPDASKEKDRSLCYRYRFKGAVNNDPVRGKGVASRSHEPLTVMKPFGVSSPQLMQAFWSNEVLSEVRIIFVHPDGQGTAEKEFQEIELTNATIASIEHIAGHGAAVPDGASPEVEEIAFRFEEMTIKNIPGQTAAKYDWKNQG